MMTAQSVDNQLYRYREYLNEDPRNIELLTRTIALYLDMPRLNATALGEARALLARALTIAQDDPKLNFYAALLHIVANEFAEAAGVLVRLLESGIDNPGVRYNLGLCQLHLHQPAEALETLQVFAEQPAQHIPQAKLLLARALHHRGDLSGALQQVEQYLSVLPESGEAIGYLALLQLDGDGENDECRRLALDALRFDAENSEALIVLGMLELEQFEIETAMPYFERVLARNSNSGRAWLAQGIAALSTQQADLAEELLDKAVATMPAHLGTRVALGWSQIVQQKFTTAESTFQAAIDLNRTFGESHAGLAITWIMQNRIPEATERTKLAKRLSPPGAISVQFAESLLAYVAGDAEKARAMVFDLIDSPITPNARPLREAVLKLGRGRGVDI
jgi:tetratricopeptide (TPR) repeat protein